MSYYDEMRGVYLAAGRVPVTREMMEDCRDILGVVDAAIDRVMCPWRYPDPNPMPHVTAVPLLARLSVTIRRR